MRCFLALMCLLATPLHAQDTEASNLVDASEIDICLDGLPESQTFCIGAAASQCDLVQSAGLAACTLAEAQLWEEWRIEAQQVLIDAALARERANPTVGKGSLTFALQQMERAWQAYRDAICSHAALAFDDAASVDDASACHLQVTAQQTLDLWQLETLYLTR